MSETKINLDAFLKRNSHEEIPNDNENNWTEQDIQASDTSLTQESLDIPASHVVKEPVSESTTKEEIVADINVEPSLSINKEIEAWLEAVHEEIEESKPAEVEVLQESKFSAKKHTLSLDALLGKSAPQNETNPKNQGSVAIEAYKEEKKEISPEENSIQINKEEEKEVFWNYESKFTSQSTKILERLRVPKTRVGMLASLALFSFITIGVLMYVNPKTHSISNYKASIKSIYNDIKTGSESQESKPWPTGITWEIEDISRKDNIQSQDIIEWEDTDNTEEEQPRKKEDIKKENLKNFLLENYK